MNAKLEKPKVNTRFLTGRNIGLSILSILIAVGIGWFLAPRGKTFHGKTIEDWYELWKMRIGTQASNSDVHDAFRQFGPSATQFLISKLELELTPKPLALPLETKLRFAFRNLPVLIRGGFREYKALMASNVDKKWESTCAFGCLK